MELIRKNDPVELARLQDAIAGRIARRTTLNPVDIANFETIIDIANVGIAVKALEKAEFPFKFTIERGHSIEENDVMAIFDRTAGRLHNNLVIDLANSTFATDRTRISFYVSDGGLTEDDSFTKHEKIFLKSAAFWMERCYNIAVYQNYLKKNDKVFIAGGALNRFYRRALTAKQPWQGSIGDVDFWFMDEESTIRFRDNWGIGNQKDDENEMMQTSYSKGVYTTTKGLDPLYCMKFQFIHFICLDPELLGEHFDFRHCCPFWTSDDKMLYVQPTDFAYIKQQMLAPCKDVPITEKRLRKYQEQGFQKILPLNSMALTIDQYIESYINVDPSKSLTTDTLDLF